MGVRRPASPYHRPLSVAAVYVIHLTALAVVGGALAIGALAHVPAAFALGGAVVAGEVVAFAVLRRRAGAVARGLADATALVDQSREAEAAVLLDRLARDSRLIPNLHALILQRRAGLFFAAGNLAESEALDRAVVQSGWYARPQSTLYTAYPALCGELAVLCALKGDDAEATTWRDRAHASVTEVRRGTLVFMDGLLAARRGEHAEAIRQILAVGAAGRVPTHAARILRWILAYSADKVAPPAERAADVARTIALARSQPHETLALAPVWPELAAFVREHTTPPAADPPQ